MRERAGELGGSVTVTRPPGGGTAVRAVLPVEVP
jgi:signal transduction histidine kinase